MDRKDILVTERPQLSQLAISEDSLLNDETAELAQYASRHLGYSKLMETQRSKRLDQDQRAASLSQTNSLVQALQTEEIDVFSKDSVKKYQVSMVRHGWMKFILNPEKCLMLTNVFFLMPAIATLVFLFGWLNEWQSVLLATLFQLPMVSTFTKELVSCLKGDRGFLFWFAFVTLSPTTSLILVVLGYGKGWSAVPFIAALVYTFCLYDDSVKQLKNTKIRWVRIPIRSYNEEIPLFVISKMRQIHKLCPSTEFYVEKLEADIYLPDPFLVVRNPVGDQEFYIEVWDEARFEAKYT